MTHDRTPVTARSEVVGSLLRPSDLVEARRRLESGDSTARAVWGVAQASSS